MSTGHTSGVKLTITAPDELAVRIWEMWDNYNTQRRNALLLGDEARNYVFAIDIDTTTASMLPHKNRTHQPKLTEISDNLQSQYWDATLSSPEWFKFEGRLDEDRQKAKTVEAWIRSKLEQRKFRETVGRELLADFVQYGNAFCTTDYVRELNGEELIYQGPIIERVAPLDIVFNPQATMFNKSVKIIRKLVHIAEMADWPNQFPSAQFSEEKIKFAIDVRKGDVLQDWVQVLKEHGLLMDGYGTFNEYFRQDMVEVLIYRGDVFDPDTGNLQRNRIVYIIDRAHVILNNDNTAPKGFDGLHKAGWRNRNDNLWSQGPLDNLIGMQYRIDHLENLKADIFDLIAHPVLKVKGEGVQMPEDGYAPGSVYFLGLDEDIDTLVPDTTALNADTQIATYHNLMETFAGSPPETRGIRTPGEKTAFEVDKLDSNASRMFVDKARAFEMLLENVLQEVFVLMLDNFDGIDFIETFNDISGQREIDEIVLEDVRAQGQFTAMGAKHWSKRNRETVEMRDFQLGPMQDPKIRAHVSGLQLANFYEKKLGIEDEEIIEPFAGVKEDVQIEAIARAEAEQFRVSPEPGQEPQIDSRLGEAQDLPAGIVPQGQGGAGPSGLPS